MSLSSLERFCLVRGTALSLRYGHRTSIDLDIFGLEGYVPDSIVAELKEHFGGRLDYRGAGTSMGIFCFIDGVKVDIVKYPFATIEEIVVEEGIRFYADQDIAAMKAQAILGRGKRRTSGI